MAKEYTDRQYSSRVTVKNCSFSYTFLSGFQQRILLGVDAKACRKADTSPSATVASWACDNVIVCLEQIRVTVKFVHTSTLVAILKMPRGTIVPCADDTAFPNKNASHSSFHTVTPMSSKRCKLHEILIPVRPQALLIIKIQCLQRSVKLFEGGRRVEQFDLGLVCQISTTNISVI